MDVNLFIFCFIQAPARKHKFQRMFPGTVLPPQPIITRWGTWIEAAIYFAEHFDKIKAFLDELDARDAKSIEKAKVVILVPSLKKDLAFIKSNFECLVTSVNKLQARGMSLDESLEIVESVHIKLKSMRRRTEFAEKFDRVIARNKGFLVMKEVSTILGTGKATKSDEFIEALSPDELNAFSFAPITSCDVERSFSKYNQVLRDLRRSFLFENLKMHVVIYCNNFE